MNACKQCKHFAGFGYCYRNVGGTEDLVTGGFRYHLKLDCNVERYGSGPDICGVGGKYFEAIPVKLSLWQRFKAHSMSGATNFGSM